MLLALGSACAGPAPGATPAREGARAPALSQPVEVAGSDELLATEEEAQIEISVAPARSYPFVGTYLPEIRIAGPDLAYTRIRFFEDVDGDGLPGEGEVFEVLESRGPGPVVLRGKQFDRRPRIMGEIHVEDSQGRSRHHRSMLLEAEP